MNYLSKIKSRVKAASAMLLNFSLLKKKLKQNKIDNATRANVLETYNDLEPETFDKEQIVSDYMMMCGYTEDEALQAYGNLIIEQAIL